MGLLEDWGVTPDMNGSYTPAEQPATKPSDDEGAKTDDGEGGTQPINRFLAARRARFAKELEQDPTLRLHLAAMQMTEGESRGGTVESLLNRADMQGKHARDMLGLTPDGVPSVNSFYGPIRDAAKGKSNRFFEALKRIERNPKLLDTFDQYTRRALAGSHVIGGYTDQGMPTDPNGSARTGIKGLSFGDGNEFVDYAAGSSPDFGTGRAAAIAYRKFIEENIGKDDPEAAKLYATIQAAATPNVPGYVPRTGPRRPGSAPGYGYVDNPVDGGYDLAGDEPPTAMLYGAPRKHTNARMDYIRSGIPGVQEQYVPPEMRGPFRAKPKPLPISEGSYAVGQPTVPPVFDTASLTPADGNLPGLPLDDATPIDAKLAALLSKPIETTPTPAIMQNAPNISVPAAPVTMATPANTIKLEEVATAIPTPKLATPVLPPDTTKPTTTLGVPTVPISGPQAGDELLPRTEIVKKEEPASFMDMLAAAKTVGKDTLEGAKQFASKAEGNLTGYPFDLAAGVRAAVPSFSGIDRKASAENLVRTGMTMREGSDFQFGVPATADTPFQTAAILGGRNFTPAGAYTAAFTTLMASADFASQLIGTANAKPMMTKQQAEEILFPGVGNNQIGPQLPPRVSHTVETSAGPYKLDEGNYKLLGIIGGASIGFAVAPAIIGRIVGTRQGTRLVGRAVAGVPDDVEAFSNRGDMLRSYDDKGAGLMRIMKGIGVDPIGLDRLQTKLDFQTGSAVRNYANTFIETGSMKSPTFAAQLPDGVRSLGALARTETDEVTNYMHLYHTLDEIREQDRVALGRAAAQNSGVAPGPSTVRGMDETTVLREIHNYESGPNAAELQAWRSDYQENMTTVRNFLRRGSFNTLTNQGFHILQRRRPNQIHQTNLDLENVDAGPQRAAETLQDYTIKQMRIRMENDAKGDIIHSGIGQRPTFSREITTEEYNNNKKSWGPNVVEVYVGGVKKRYVLDPTTADMLNMDMYMPSGILSSIANGSRTIMEATTTGKYAPFFSFVNMYRNHKLAQLSPEEGFKSPFLHQTFAAVPQQIYPQMATFFAERFEAMSGGWFGQALGSSAQNALHSMSMKLAQVYDQSMFANMLEHGGIHANLFEGGEYNRQAANQIAAVLDKAPLPNMPESLRPVHEAGRTVLHGLKGLFDAIHNSANFAYAAKNIKAGRSVGEAVRSAKQLTGDPQKTGRFYNSKGEPIRYADDNLGGYLATKGVQAIGAVTEIGRTAVPWWNVTTQGMKRVGQAYLDDPVKFITRSYLHNILPASAIYAYTRGLGNDPNGLSYTDYMMNRRGAYNSFMTIYIPIPGQPAENGIVLPLPHEIATMWAMTNTALHHATGTELFNRTDDFMRAALSMVGKDYKPSNDVPLRSWVDDGNNILKSIRDNALMPATPPLVGALYGAQGIVTPNGPFGGAYQRHDEVFDTEGMNTSFELVARAQGAGVADIVGSMYAAFTHSEDAYHGAMNALKAGSNRMIAKTPIVREFGKLIPDNSVIGYKPIMTGSTPVTDEMFDDKKGLGKLAKFYKERDPDRDRSNKKPTGFKSGQGKEIADIFMPELPPDAGKGLSLGLPAKQPINALYNYFISELDRKLNKDVVGKDGLPAGGIGFPSQMARYNAFTAHLKAMRKIDIGNMASWQARIEHEPKLKEYLEEHNVSTTDPVKVKNFLETERQTTARQLMFTLKAIEQDFQKRLNNPKFSFDDLDPNQPMLLPPGFDATPQVPTWPPYADQVHAKEKQSHHKKVATP